MTGLKPFAQLPTTTNYQLPTTHRPPTNSYSYNLPPTSHDGKDPARDFPMMSVGRELKQARERAALSIEQIAERTKIQAHKLEALETDDLDALPHGIYLEGIVRAYAHEVAIDPMPLIDRIRLEHPEPAGVWTAPVVLNGVQDKTPLHVIEDIDVFPLEDIDDFPSEEIDAGTRDEGRGLAPVAHVAPVAPNPPREMELARPTKLVLAAAVVAVALSQATNLFDSDEPPEAIFSVPVSSTSAAVVTPSAKPQAQGLSTMQSLPDVSGTWALNTHVESTSYSRFAGLQLGYQIDLQRDGNRVTGEGRKVTENGRKISSKAQTPITVDGAVEGDRLKLAFNAATPPNHISPNHHMNNAGTWRR
jgi:hypothetical protein